MKKLFAIVLISLTAFFLFFYQEKSNVPLPNIAFVNKSFERDLPNSLRQYKSFESFVEPKSIPFYIVAPQDELELFNEKFLDAQKIGEIKNLPNFISEEEVMQKCGEKIYEKAKDIGGWKIQQIIKLCFGKTGLAENYLTIDSDTYFTKPFNPNILFKNGEARTYINDRVLYNNELSYKRQNLGLFTNSYDIKQRLNDPTPHYNNFVSGFAMWNSKMLDLLAKYMEESHGYDFVDMINLAPLEMQWYGNFVFTHHPEKFHPLPDVFTSLDKNVDDVKAKCYPSEGLPWHYGVSYHHYTEEPYVNKCGDANTKFKLFTRTVQHLKSKVISYVNMKRLGF